MWQGEGQKLRNLPVEFVKSLENYDPGKWLQEQLDSRAKDGTTKELPSPNTEDSASDAEKGLSGAGESDIEIQDTPNTTADELDVDDLQIDDVVTRRNEFATGEHDPGHFQTVESIADDNASDSQQSDLSHDDLAFTTAADAYYAVSNESLSSRFIDNFEEEAAPLDGTRHESSSVNPIQIGETSNSPLSIVLEALNTANINDISPDELGLATHATNDQGGIISIKPIEDSSLFVVDLEGDPNMLLSDQSANSEDENIMITPRNPAKSPCLPSGSIGHVASTPWARTIDDPVTVSSDTLADPMSNPAKFGHAFEDTISSQRGKRGGKRKKAKVASQTSRQEELELMLDYMDNAQWSDVSDEEDDVDGAMMAGDSAEPIINQLLSDLVPQVSVEEGRPSSDEAEELGSTSDSDSEDDTDIDDDLELMIDAEMEEMEFDLGYSRGAGSNNRRHGSDRELVDSVLYHEDLNVYDYRSDKLAQFDALGASGANKRGLNKFINDLDLSDEELEADLIAQWQKDRGSKKAKKRERQRLHQDGLIGKKAKRARAAHEVPNHGHSELDSYHEHIKNFVSREDYMGIEELPMPTMDKALRRAVHVLSQAYSLHSASQGSGKRRYITLYKTKHASVPEAEYLEDTLVRARRSLGFNTKHRDRLLPDNVKGRLGRTGRPGKNGPGSGGGRLRDGDKVGADAPEIGLDNRGRQMLEKLGWAHGSGLGAGSQGIFVPLFATIKSSKAGL